MPFAGYPNFAACVADKQGKADDPAALCAWLEHETTGKWPGEMTQGLPAGIKDKFWQAFGGYMDNEKNEAKAMEFAVKAVADAGWVWQKHGWARKAEHKMQMQAVLGVPIFATGTHNDEKYTAADLKEMVTAFKELKGILDPPVKIGHTSDEFNRALAEKMGIEPELIKGENGNGVMAFGWIDDLRVSGNVLYADLADVPQPVAELIESKSYNKVSAEVMFDFKHKDKTYPKVLCGLALLGAELPAVRESGLETAAVYMVTREPDSVIEFALDLDADVTFEMLQPAMTDIEEAIERQMKGKAGVSIIRAMWKEVKGKVKHMLEAKKHSMGDIPPEIQAYADANFQGNVEGLIRWAGEVGFNGCVSAVSGKEGITDPERLCGWLKAQARERGWLSPAHQSLEKGEEVQNMNKEFLKALGLAESAKDEDVMAALKKLQDGKVDLTALFTALGLPPEATLEDAVKAIGALKEQAAAAVSGATKQFSDRVTQLEKDNKALKRENRKAYFKEIAAGLKAISGTPDELAEELVSLEESAGEETVKKILARYQDQNKRLIAAGVFKAKGTSAAGGEEEDHEFLKKVKAHMQEKHVDEATAQAVIRKAEPVLFKDYMATRKIVTRAVEGSED